jgi:aminoglycoside phosphotransferase (APT) family kinase protein
LFAGVTDASGTPTTAELLDRYHARGDIEPVALDWYVAFACFKLAVILEGIHFRHELGKTVGSASEGVSETVVPLVEHGLGVARDLH